MLDEQQHQHLTSLATRRRQVLDVGVGDREELDLPHQRCLHEQAAVPPEVRVTADDLGERHQEVVPHVGSPFRVGDSPDPPAGVHELEERLGVVAHDPLADRLHRRLQALGQLVVPAVPGRTEVAVGHAHHLGEGERGDDISAGHLLLPADATPEHEALVLAETVEHLDHLQILSQVPEQNVAAQLRPVGVEHLEPVAFPLLGGREVDGGTEVRRHVTGLQHVLHGGGHPLETVHDEDLVLQVEASGTIDEPLPPHAELDVGQRHARLDRLDQTGQRGDRKHLALVGCDLKVAQGLGVDHPAEHDVSRGGLVEGCVADLDSHGWIPFVGP